MTDKNTCSKGEYIFDHILWGLISWLWFSKTLFRNIGGLTYDRSRLVLLGALAASVLLGIAVTWKKRRNDLSLFVNLVIPYEIYTLIVYRETASVLARILIITSVCLSAVYTVLVLTPRIRAGARKAVVLWRRLTHSALGVRTIAACCLSVLLLVLGVSSVFRIAFFSPSAAADDPPDHEEVTIAENIDVLSRLDEDTWAQLSSREKLDTLQTVANIEASYFGLPHTLNVVSGSLEHDVLACYHDRTHSITIDLYHLEHDPARYMLNSLCHEARHAYQCRLCDVYDSATETQKTLLLFRSIRLFQQEFSNYVKGSDDQTGYYTQQCEADARAYAAEATADYYAQIDAYLKENRA